ncbi:hypothetical protein F5879DRAFT_995105 [Lentinula edodes]|nr:hypothetical protein F5879DRAFT_995105 [Lentinula edodes]
MCVGVKDVWVVVSEILEEVPGGTWGGAEEVQEGMTSADASTMLPPEFTFEQMMAGYQGILDTGLSSSVSPVSKVLSPVIPPAVITPPAVTPPAVTSPTVPPPATPTPSAPPLAEPKKKRGGQKAKKAKAQNTVTKQKIAPENVRIDATLEDTIDPDERTQKRSRSFSKSEDIDVLNKRLKSDSVQPQVDQCSTATSASAGVTTTRSGRTTVAPRCYVKE